jgi:hypothetical protein
MKLMEATDSVGFGSESIDPKVDVDVTLDLPELAHTPTPVPTLVTIVTPASHPSHYYYTTHSSSHYHSSHPCPYSAY